MVPASPTPRAATTTWLSLARSFFDHVQGVAPTGATPECFSSQTIHFTISVPPFHSHSLRHLLGDSPLTNASAGYRRLSISRTSTMAQATPAEQLSQRAAEVYLTMYFVDGPELRRDVVTSHRSGQAIAAGRRVRGLLLRCRAVLLVAALVLGFGTAQLRDRVLASAR